MINWFIYLLLKLEFVVRKMPLTFNFPRHWHLFISNNLNNYKLTLQLTYSNATRTALSMVTQLRSECRKNRITVCQLTEIPNKNSLVLKQTAEEIFNPISSINGVINLI